MTARTLLFLLFTFLSLSAYGDVSAPEGVDCKKDELSVATSEFQSFIKSYIKEQKDLCTAGNEESADEFDFEFDFDETSSKSDNNACPCLLDRYQDELPEKIADLQNKHDLYYKRSVGKLIEASFMETSLNLEQTANGLENRGYDTNRLAALGGICNPISQIADVKKSCGGADFSKRLQEYFDVSTVLELGKKLEGHKSAIRGEGEGTGCLNVFENDSIRLAEKLNAPDTENKLEQLRVFLNVTMDSIKGKPEYQNMSPMTILGKLKDGDVKLKLLYKFVSGLPMLKAMLQSTDAAALLKESVNRHWNKKNDAIVFLDSVLGTDTKQNDYIYESMKKQCDSFKQKLEAVFCQKMEEPLIISKDGIFEERFPLGETGGDSVEKAYLCYADSYAKKGEGSIDKLYQAIKGQTSNDYINEPGEVSERLRQGNELFSKDLCLALECQNPVLGQDKCVKIDPVRTASEVLEGPMCKENPEKGYPISQCKEPILSQYLALQKYQEGRKQLMSEMIEVLDPNATPDEKGNVATIKVARERASFSNGFWKQELPVISKMKPSLSNNNNNNNSDSDDNDERSTITGGAGIGTKTGANSSTVDKSTEQTKRVQNPSDLTVKPDLPASRRPFERTSAKNELVPTHRVIERTDMKSKKLEAKLKKLEDSTSKVVAKAERMGDIAQEEQERNSDLENRISRLKNKIASLKSDGASSHDGTDVDTVNAASRWGGRPANATANVVGAASVGTGVGQVASAVASGKDVGSGASVGAGVLTGGKQVSVDGKGESTDEQILTLTLDELPKLESERLKAQGIDPQKGFTIELKAKDKVYHIPVKQMNIGEKVVFAPRDELITRLETEDQSLLQTIKSSPFFSEYFMLKELEEKKQREAIRAKELNQVLTKQ